MENKSLIFIVSGPGGVGKTTLLKRLFLRKIIKQNFVQSVSMTTRKKRFGEKEGKDYFFVSKEYFEKKLKAGSFLESEKVLDDYYGTPKSCYDQALKSGKSLVLCIDVKGGMYLKKKVNLGRIVTIFIAPPQKAELKKRLEKREEKKTTIKNRVKLAKQEMSYAREYDYVLVNKKLTDSLNLLEAYFLAEKFRRP
ncbi:MAG: guanylate kinase [Candidatus Omnitrophica bacterium]|nr:guanylate kinase [Candidatus Omnitrophota bacterium]